MKKLGGGGMARAKVKLDQGFPWENSPPHLLLAGASGDKSSEFCSLGCSAHPFNQAHE